MVSHYRCEGDELQGGEDQVVHLLMWQVTEQGRLKYSNISSASLNQTWKMSQACKHCLRKIIKEIVDIDG